MTRGYRCDNCHRFTEALHWIFDCIWCGKEICESCMHGDAACKECAKGKSNSELATKFEESCK
jgi:hypothetical protein